MFLHVFKSLIFTLVNHAKFGVDINVVLFLHKLNNGNYSTASYLHPFYKNSSIVLYILDNINQNIRPVRMLNSTFRFGTLLFKCLGTFLHNQNCHAFGYPDRFAC